MIKVNEELIKALKDPVTKIEREADGNVRVTNLKTGETSLLNFQCEELREDKKAKCLRQEADKL